MNTMTEHTLLFGWETKICNFQIIFCIKEDVLWFQISVYYIGNIVKIVHGTKKLLEVVTRKLFVKPTSGILYLNVRKKVALLNQFKYNKINLYGFSRIFDNNFTVTIVFNKLDNIWMIQPF